MPNEQNVEDILLLYRDGYSKAEIKEEYPGIDPKYIDDICEEEYHSWDAE